jgi:hypothetical protein
VRVWATDSHQEWRALLIGSANETATLMRDAAADGLLGSSLRLNIRAEKMFLIYRGKI